MVAKPGGQKDVPYLAKLIAEQNVQSLLITSSVLDLMVDSFKEHPPAALRDVCNCGEAFPVAVWRKAEKRIIAPIEWTSRWTWVYPASRREAKRAVKSAFICSLSSHHAFAEKYMTCKAQARAEGGGV